MIEFIIAPFPVAPSALVPRPAAPLTTLKAALQCLETFSIMHGAELMYEVDADHPSCADAMMFLPDGGLQQFTIQPAGFSLAL